MNLLQLLGCDIYRDGGSLEGIWLTDENKEWIVTLKIAGDWDRPHTPQEYELFNCPVNEARHNVPVAKHSPEHTKINMLIEQWLIEKNIKRDDLKNEVVTGSRLYDLLLALEAGNY